MQINRRKFIKMALATSSAALVPATKAFAAPPTPITSLPATITSSGAYILSTNISVSLEEGAAITVNADNVTIDLNGKTITNTGASADTIAAGIFTERDSLTVENGKVKGFYVGVYTQNKSNNPIGGHHINLVEADSCLGSGFMIDGSGCVIRGCTVVNHGRATFGTTPTCSYSFGIVINHGVGTLAAENTIDSNGYSSSDNSIGLFVGQYARDTILLDNQVTNAKACYLITPNTRCEARGNQTGTTDHPYYGSVVDLGGNT